VVLEQDAHDPAIADDLPAGDGRPLRSLVGPAAGRCDRARMATAPAAA
jgi:hypothetical protein